MGFPAGSQSVSASSRYGWLTFLIILITVLTLGVGIFLLGYIEQGIVAVVWFPLLALLIWSTIRLHAEYRKAQQESAWARAAEAALLQSQERNRVIVDTVLDGVITIDAAGIITDWNAQAAMIFGWTREEALGKLLTETIIPPRDREAHVRGIRKYLKTGVGPVLNRRIEVVARHKDGREFPVELSVSPARIGEAYIFSAFIRDITDRRRTERRLASQYAVTRVLAEAVSLEEAVPKNIQAVGESLEWEVGVFWRLDKLSGTLRCLDQWKSATLDADPFVMATQQQAFKPGIGLPGRIWESGRPGSGTWRSIPISFGQRRRLRQVFMGHSGFQFASAVRSRAWLSFSAARCGSPMTSCSTWWPMSGSRSGNSANVPEPKRRCIRRKHNSSNRRRWKRSGASRAGSPTTSTICSRSFGDTAS
jgi:PAS domain S-box-containing protein